MANRNDVMGRTLSSQVIVVVALAIAGATSANGAERGTLRGVVIDGDTGRPIEGAYVVRMWMAAYFNPVDAVTPRCTHHEVTTSRNDGSFELKDWNNYHIWQIDRSTSTFAVKEGYVSQTGSTEERIVLTRSKDSVEERLRTLARTAFERNCEDWGAKSVSVGEARLIEARGLEVHTDLERGLLKDIERHYRGVSMEFKGAVR